MRLEFVKAFVEITEAIFQEVLADPVVSGKVSLECEPRCTGNIVSIIELSGEVAGRILLQMELATALQIAQRMLAKSVNDPIDNSLVAACIAELSSMAVGRAISWLNDQTYAINMGPPIVTFDVDALPELPMVETLVFPLATSYGTALLNISFIDLDYQHDDQNFDQRAQDQISCDSDQQ